MLNLGSLPSIWRGVSVPVLDVLGRIHEGKPRDRCLGPWNPPIFSDTLIGVSYKHVYFTLQAFPVTYIWTHEGLFIFQGWILKKTDSNVRTGSSKTSRANMLSWSLPQPTVIQRMISGETGSKCTSGKYFLGKIFPRPLILTRSSFFLRSDLYSDQPSERRAGTVRIDHSLDLTWRPQEPW